MLYNYHITERWLTSVSDLIIYEVGNFDQNNILGNTFLIKDFSNIIILCYNAGPSCMFIHIVGICKIGSYIYVNYMSALNKHMYLNITSVGSHNEILQLIKSTR